MKAVYLATALRTPIGSFGGSLASLSAVQLGVHAAKAVLDASGVDPYLIDEVLLGNVLSAGLGQAPARQVALGAGLPNSVPATTINKVCSSGMKSIMLAAQAISLGQADFILAGGFESMSNVPFYLPKARFGYKFGSGELLDGLQYDGLRDAYDEVAMGVSADQTAAEGNISREDQDAYAVRSYESASAKTQSGRLGAEIAPISIPQRKGDPIVVEHDEEYSNVRFEKISTLRPAFSKEGTVTAANASTLNDGASAVLVASEAAITKFKLTPLARIAGYADAAREPMRFPLAPTLATPLALERAGIAQRDVGVYEVNEAFAVVPIAYARELDLDPALININGGAVSLGHPLGMSGARITCSLAHELSLGSQKYGVAAICNGGGGASAIVLERV